MPRLAAVLALLLAAAALAPATAGAGTYHVFTCAAGGGQFANLAWGALPSTGYVTDTDCRPRGSLIGLRVDPTTSVPDNTGAALRVTTPAGTTVADFTLSRELEYNGTPSVAGTHALYALYQLGPTVFAGAGYYANAVRNQLNALKSWYGYPAGNVDLPRATVTRAGFPALAGYGGDANTLTIQVGCFKAGTPCSATARAYHVLYGVDLVVNDPVPPLPTVAAEGLLAGGERDGSDPVVLTATDSAGIRGVELLDVTNPGAPQLVGAEDYETGTTDSGRGCVYSKPAPCPALTRELVRPTALPAGVRRVVVRTIDAGGNATDRGPYTVVAVTPSDRGALNGSGATETGTLTAGFAFARGTSRTVDYGARVRVRGRLTNAAGAPVAGAELLIRTRDKRPAAPLVQRATIRTAPDGSYTYLIRAFASRTLEVAWLSHAYDSRPTATAQLTLLARARATLRASTRRPRVGRRMTLRGRLLSPARRVTVLLQGRRIGTRRWMTFADTSTDAHGRFRVGYRFRTASARGVRFAFRAKVRPGARYPFTVGYSRALPVRVR
jgi:hypothetical protein